MLTTDYNLTGYDNFTGDIKNLTEHEKNLLDAYIDVIMNHNSYNKNHDMITVHDDKHNADTTYQINYDDTEIITIDDILYSSKRYCMLTWCCKRIFEHEASANGIMLPDAVQALILENASDELEKNVYNGFNYPDNDNYDYNLMNELIEIIMLQVNNMLTVFTAFTGESFYDKH